MSQNVSAPALDTKISEFLAQRRIGVAGVSRTRSTPATAIYRKLKSAGYQVFAISPATTTFEGDPCYPDVLSVPGGLDGVVIVTRPEVTNAIVRQCAQAGIKRVWMHQSLTSAGTSVSPEAVAFCREHGITVIGGVCPMMFCPPVDVAHACMRWLLRVSGGLPH